ncbi:MAG: DoxX family membrane protein [Candidatus Paceibacterota bacterium]
MFQSLKYSNLALRLSLACVFLWFGIDKFLHPDYWFNAWVPQSVAVFWESIGLKSMDIVYVSAVFEILVGVSLITNIFVFLFSGLSVVFLLSIMFFNGLNEVLIRDIGLMGAFLSLMLWPRSRKF